MPGNNPIGSPTNYPQGFANGLSVRGVPLLQAQPGVVFWLNNSNNPLLSNQHGGSDGNRGTYLDPFATLNHAIASCQPGRGDIIMVGSGHYETVSSATATALQVSGVAIVGLGAGPFRPTFSFDTATTSTIVVGGAGISIQNCLFVGNFLSIASAFTGTAVSFTGVVANNVLTASAVTGTINIGNTIAGTGVELGSVIVSQLSGTTGGAGQYVVSGNATVASVAMTISNTDFAIDNCEFRDNSSVLGFLTLYTTSATANSSDGFCMTRTSWWSQSTVSVTCALITTVNHDRWNLSDNVMVSPITAVTQGPILLAAGAASLTNFTMARNHLTRPNTSTSLPTAVSSSGTSWTGHCYDNYIGTGLSGSTGIWISTGTKLSFTNNYSMITRAADKSALINPAAV